MTKNILQSQIVKKEWGQGDRKCKTENLKMAGI